MGRRRQKLPTPPESLTLIENLSHEGRGIAHIGGKALFLRNALPNEQVKFNYSASKSTFAEGYATEISNPSSERIAPQCLHYNRCGGCSTQHIQHDFQLTLKQKTLLEHFQHFANLQPLNLLPTLSGPIWNYRTKGRLSCRYLKNSKKVFLGFREINGRMITAAQQCSILDKRFSLLFEPLATLISQFSIAAHIPQVELAAGDKQAALIFRHMEAFSHTDLTAIIEFAKTFDLEIYLQPSGPKSVHKIYPKNSPERLTYQLPEQNITIHFFPTDFTQVNMAINQKMVAKAIELLDPKPHEKILDLFCGLGNFSLPIAKYCAHVTAVEGSEEMVSRGNENAKLNKINNIDFYAANLYEKIEDFPWSQEKFAKILLDPPRSGAYEIIEKISEMEPERIVYISCNPATLARDAKGFVDKGYELSAAGIIDMFPHTSHVESIAVFNRAKGK